jgi:hypothetical protein
MGAGNLPANPTSAVTIYNPGDADFTGYAIAVEPEGHAWSMDGAGRSQSQLPYAVTQALFSDLAAAGPLAQIAARPCTASRENSGTNSQTNPGVYLVWHGQHSPNLQCASDPRADRLLADAVAIARAMYVRAYRVRPMVLNGGSSGGYQDNYQPAQPAGAAASAYANGGGSYGNAGYASAGYGSGSYASGGYATSCGCNGSGYSFGMAGSPFSGLPSSGIGLSNSFSSSTFSSLSVNSGVFGRSTFSNGFGNGSFSNGTFGISGAFGSNGTIGGNGTFGSNGTFSNSTFSSQPFSNGPGSSTPNSGFSFH